MYGRGNHQGVRELMVTGSAIIVDKIYDNDCNDVPYKIKQNTDQDSLCCLCEKSRYCGAKEDVGDVNTNDEKSLCKNRL